MYRRRYIALLGATALAGCTGGAADGSDGGSNGDSDDGGSTPTEPSDSTPADETDSPTVAETDEPTEPATEAPAGEVKAAVGDLVEGENMHLVIESVERELSETVLTPEPGNEFVRVSLALKNVSDEYLSVSSLLQTRLRDDENYQYRSTVIGDNQPRFTDGQFVPGEVGRGSLAFEVPEDVSGLQLVFDFDVSIFGGVERATIDLTSEASSAHKLEQDLTVDVHQPGDSVSHGDVEATLHGVRTESSLGQFAEADEGNEYAIVDISITNNTGEQQRFSSALQMPCKDSQGYSYTPAIAGTTSLDQAFDEGTPLGDGETRRGELPYQVPEGMSPLYWVFEFQLFANGDKTFWQIQ